MVPAAVTQNGAMTELEDEGDPDETAEPPHVDNVVVTARGGFQSLNGANPAFKAVFEDYEAVADGTAGRVVLVPSHQLPDLLRSLAELLERDFQHAKSQSSVLASAGIDNWVLAIQAVSPSP
jgi:hypothetical protein